MMEIVKKGISITGKFISFGLVGLAVLLTFYSSGYYTSLLLSFVVQFSIVSLLFAVVFLFQKKWKLVAVNLGAFILFYSFYLPFTNSSNLQEKEDFSVAHFNVLKYNREFDKTIDLAKKTNAEILSFQEVDNKWGDNLKEKLKDEYPYSIVVPREDCYGLALFSKLKLSEEKIDDMFGFPILKGKISTEKRDVSFVCIHTRAPIGRNNFYLRNDQIEQLAEDVKILEGAKLVIGDFNSVPWDTAIEDFKMKTSLHDSRKKITPTYPAYLPIAGIPIDFIFHSREINCLSFESLKGSDSDHLGVCGKYSLIASK